jgi:hypothetical protein
MVGFLSAAVAPLYAVFEKQAALSVIQVVKLATRTGALVVGGALGSLWLALGLLTVSGVLVQGHQTLRAVRYAGVASAWVLRSFGRGLLLFAPFGALLWWARLAETSSLGMLVLGMLAIGGCSAVHVVRERALGSRASERSEAQGR